MHVLSLPLVDYDGKKWPWNFNATSLSDHPGKLMRENSANITHNMINRLGEILLLWNPSQLINMICAESFHNLNKQLSRLNTFIFFKETPPKMYLNLYLENDLLHVNFTF